MSLLSPDSGSVRGFDPSSFTMSVVMNTPDGIRVPLWMKGTSGEANEAMASIASVGAASAGGVDGPLSSADLLAMDLPVVESVSIEMSLGHVGKVTVDIAATYEMGLRLLDSAFFTVGNTIEVQLGYYRAQRFMPWVTAITAKPSIKINAEEGLSATLNGEGGGFSSLRGVSNKTYKGKSYKEIIEEITEEAQWEVEFPEETSEDGSDGLTVSREVTSQGNMTDWFFIQHMCHVAGCNAYMGPSEDKNGRFKVVIVRRDSAFAAPPRFRFVARGQSDFINVFPMLDFETEAEFVWLPGGAVKTSTSDILLDSKEVDSRDATAESSSVPALGKTGTPNSAKKTISDTQVSLTNTDGPNRTGEFLVVSSRDPRRPQDMVQSHRDELAVRGGVTAKVTAFGIPELLPGDVVQLDAIGVFNGLYGINSITHTANDTEWTMVLELINNASAGGIFQSFFVKSEPEKSNTKTVDETDAGNAGVEDVNPVPQN